MNDELERIWKEMVMAYFKVPSWHLSEESEEKHKNLSQDSRSPGQDLNLRHPIYEV
jgi:predicted P-loop ATPase